METTIYRHRFDPDRTVEAVQLTEANGPEVFEWAPGKQFYGPQGVTTSLTIFTLAGRMLAQVDDYVCRDSDGGFWVHGAEIFEMGWEPTNDSH